MEKAKPQYRGNRVRFTLVVPTAVFDAIDAASSDFEMSWRQLAQKAIRDFAANLPEATLPESAEAEKISA